MKRAPPLVVRLRHPVTGARFKLRAQTPQRLAALRERIESMAVDLRIGLRSAEDVSTALRHLRFGAVTLERAALSYCDRPELAPNTRRNVRGLLATHWRELKKRPLASLDGPTVTRWIERLAARAAPSTVRTLWRCLRTVVAHAASRDWIGALPWGAARPRLPSGRSRERECCRTVGELVALLAAARELDEVASGRGKLGDSEAKIGACALLGLRRGELAGLRWGDLDTGPPLRVLVARQYDGAPLKTRRPTWIEAVPELADLLDAHRDRLAARGLYAPDGPIFPCPRTSHRGCPRAYARGEPLTRMNLRAAVARAFAGKLIDLGDWSPHSLRDTFVTLEGAHSRDLASLASRTRHASLASLSRYLRSQSRSPASPSLTLAGLSLDDAGSPLLGFSHAAPSTPKEATKPLQRSDATTRG